MRRHLQTISLVALASLASARASADTDEPAAIVSFGRLSISEAHDAKTAIFVDGAEVGSTPWEGTLPVGPHTVTLLGDGNLGCPPTSITVAMNQLTRATLITEPLECVLRVEPTSARASVSVDTAIVGSGAWTGPLRCGAHLVGITEPGFAPFNRQVILTKDSPGSISDRAERETAAEAKRAFVSARAGFLLAPSLNSDLSGKSSLGTGGLVDLSVGYSPYRAIELGVNVGYLALAQTFTASAQETVSVGIEGQKGSTDDAVSLGGPTAGIHASVQTGKAWLVGARLGAGLLFADWSDKRTNGRFITPPPSTSRSVGNTPYAVPDMTEKGSTSYVYVAPEVNVGYRLSSHLTARIGVDLVLLAAMSSKPSFRGSDFQGGTCPLSATNDCVGLTRYKSTPVLSTLIPIVSPTLELRYEF